MAGDSWVYQISQHPMHPYEGQSSGILPTHSVPLNTNVAHLPLSDPNSAPSDNSSSRGHSPGAFTYPPSSTHNIYRSNDLPPSRSSSFQEVDLASEHRLPNNSSYNIGPRVTVGSSLPVEQTNYVESRSTGVQLLQCTQCTQRFATHEHFIKHQTKHQKLHRCRVQGCSRIEGFTTPNDRDRHEKSVHKTPGMYFRCMDETCTSFMKTFARRDNLKDHLKRMHKMPPEMDEAEANERRNELADRWRVDLTPALTPPPGL
ncbi:hypothetical protein BDZ91DRAFT_127996 [Kalaharituber pfeilii]|nr:hypothetical protein BDZ91DRAFT_127996 [Kalaharituber pfeilii]